MRYQPLECEQQGFNYLYSDRMFVVWPLRQRPGLVCAMQESHSGVGRAITRAYHCCHGCGGVEASRWELPKEKSKRAVRCTAGAEEVN